MKNMLFHFGRKAESHRPPAGETCHNCHATVSTTYCGACGQKAAVHIASTHEFLHHFIGHYIAAEGKLWRTLGYLFAKPGQLTVEYIRGRRGQFIDPLRLLLTVSLLIFLVMKWQVHRLPAVEPAAQGPAAPVVATADSARAVNYMDARLFDIFARASDHFAVNYGKLIAAPQSYDLMFWESWLHFGPTVMLCLVPFMAALLKLLHPGTGWRYGEHLVFAMHVQAVNLLAMILLVEGMPGYTKLVWKAVLLLYMLLAMRKVYGGGWAILISRTLIFAYCLVMAFDWLTRIAFMFQFV